MRGNEKSPASLLRSSAAPPYQVRGRLFFKVGSICHKFFNKIWYQQPTALSAQLLSPLAKIYEKCAVLRRNWYLKNAKLKIKNFDTPIIIVGNITVGGTGKTPLVIWLANFLREQGYQPGIVSRGYGGNAKNYPQAVYPESDPVIMGDEAVLLARLSHCPVVIDPDRVKAVEYLLNTQSCNIIISDDGLQHYALGRKIEIAVIDGERGLGNQYCLPAGPLREPVSRLDSVDFIVSNGKFSEPEQPGEYPAYLMELEPGPIYNLIQPDLIAQPNDFAGQALHAIAGIGNPDRFFKSLRDLGLSIWPHRFPDHHQFIPSDIEFETDDKIIMTEKDAVKCESMADYRFWCLPVTAKLDPAFGTAVIEKLRSAL